MSDEIQSAVQIIRVGYEGVEIAMKVGAGGLSAMKQAIEFLKSMLDYEKSIGKTTMRRLLMKGGDLQVFQFKTEDMPSVEKMAKKYGILYSRLPDLNLSDGLSEIVFHSEAVPRVNMLIEKLKEGKLAGLDEYLKNGEPKEVEKFLKTYGGKISKKSATPSEEESLDDGSKKQELEDRIKAISKARDENMVDVTINKGLIVEENEKQLKTRLPGTYGESVRYIWLDKDDVVEIHDGKTILAFVDKEMNYKVYDDSGQVLELINGKNLYDKHFDEVNKKVRKRYEQSLTKDIAKPKVLKQKKV